MRSALSFSNTKNSHPPVSLKSSLLERLLAEPEVIRMDPVDRKSLEQRFRQHLLLAKDQDASITAEVSVDKDVDALWAAIQTFQITLHDAEQAALQNSSIVPELMEQSVLVEFDMLVHALHVALGPGSGRSSEECDRIGKEVQRAILPYLLLTETSERLYSKPRGYAGDAISIDAIYANQPAGTGRLGPLLDRCFLNQSSAQAVRNRRALLREEIQSVLDAHPNRVVHITSMACGPAREVFDVFDTLEDPTRLQVQLIDIDELALDQVREEVSSRGIQEQVTLHHANLVELSIGRTKIDLPPQDLIYSIGLIDYFVDKLVVRLMSYGHRLLSSGGKMILGNFHPSNSSKALMDQVLDWRLIHRTEEDLERLYTASDFNRESTQCRFEEQGINLFAECQK